MTFCTTSGKPFGVDWLRKPRKLACPTCGFWFYVRYIARTRACLGIPRHRTRKAAA